MAEEVVHLTPDSHPDKPKSLDNLGSSLLTRFKRFGELDDLNRSVSMREKAIHRAPDAHVDKPSMMNNLGNSLLIRFERLGDLSDLNKSVLMGEDALRLTPDNHPAKPLMRDSLVASLFRRFERLGDLSDLNKSLLMSENALRVTPDGHPDKPALFNNLALSLVRRFERLGDLKDINKAVSMAEDAVRLTPDGDPGKPSRLTSVGNVLLTRFEHMGQLDDLSKAVLIREDVVRLTPDDHPNKPSSMSKLATSLQTRFERLGSLGDLTMSVSMGKDAIHLTPEGHPDKPYRLNNLSSYLLTCFERLGNLDDLHESVLMGEDAVYLTPDGHPDKPSRMNNLGRSLLTRFEHLGNLDDLNKSVWMGENAVRLTPDGHQDKPWRLNNLGGSLFRRFERLGDLGDLSKAISIREDIVTLIPENHPHKPSVLNNLGNCLSRRFERLGGLDDLNRSQAICHYKHAARSITGPTHIRFHAASRWAQCAIYGEDPSLLDAYHVALNLLPELAWLGLSINDRHYHILKAGEVVRNAAAAAISFGQPEKAVEWLEQGRSVIWGQLLNLRTPVDTLSSSHPELAQRLLVLSAQLEGSGTRADSGRTESGAQDSLQSTADQAHQNAHDRDKLLKQIRALEGFSRFLLPRTITELSKAAQHGPVVILNVSKTRCDALALMPGRNEEVLHIQLDDFKPKDAESQAKSLDNLVYHRGRSERLVGRRDKQQDPEEEFANHLSELWFRVVKPVLEGLAIKNPTKANCPHIWWCPTGPLAFLPIHAAGLYGTDDAHGSKLSDFVISSYTPSLTALIEGFRPPSEAQQTFQLLAVSQPSASGQAYIPGTREEITRIQQLANGKLPVLSLDGHMATVDSVQQGMRDSRWVHFACHGVQDVSHPTESALLLAGSSRLTLSSIIQLALPHADLAFLSACQTATGDKSLQEEAVHLAAGMLLAGYRSVIATMWTISDRDAPQVASDFYEHLFKTLPPDPAQAAEALHLAVQKLRKDSGTKKSFLNWVPFIHVGV
ncbi:TPR-like protein [Mycena galopus ATCC 62051]|nr:TPR-like protein [Mycena galopus ATCC 62051]